MIPQITEITGERRNQRTPNFTLPATDGLDVTLYQFAARKRPILFFPAAPGDEPSKLFARNIAALRDELNESDAVFLPILTADASAARAWADENAKGYAVLLDGGGRVRSKYFEYFEIPASPDASNFDAPHALLVLLDLYCAPLAISHAANALELMPPGEMTKWLNALVCACSE